MEIIKQGILSYKKRNSLRIPVNLQQELLNNLFNHPYTKIKFVMRDVGVSRVMAKRYLEQLVGLGPLEKKKIWRTYYYTNTALLGLFHGQTEEGSSSYIDFVKL